MTELTAFPAPSGGSGNAGDHPMFADNVKLATSQTRAAVAGGAGMFLVEPDRAERFIADIHAAADMCKEARNHLARGRWDCSQEADAVSRNLASQAREMSDRAVDAAGRHEEALRQVAIELAEQLAAYRQAEHANTAGPPR